MARSGHTATLLLDGTVLITGGSDGTQVLDTALVFDPASGSVSALGSSLSARSGHTATLLPDGQVLLVGGTSNGTTSLDSAELFNPATQSFSALGAPALSPSNGRLSAPRVGQTATLLPDGTVLLLGGTSDGTTALASGERFDPVTQSFSALGSRLSGLSSLLRARREHAATLLGDGTLLVTGGFGSGPLGTAERLSLGPPDTTPPTVVAVRPPDQATDVAAESRVAVRFSEPINPVTITPYSFRLVDDSTNQPIDSSFAVGEGALLAFLTPTAPLTAGRIYTVEVTADLRDTSGNPLVPFTSTFTVKGAGGPLTLTPGTWTLLAGQSGTLTVQLPASAPPGGVTIALESADTGVATVDSQVTIPEGATGSTALVTAGIPTTTTATVTLTASAPGYTSATSILTVMLPQPTLTGFSPTAGKVGSSVTLTGTNFINVQSVTFNGVSAPGFSVSGGIAITVAVPAGATTGPLSVTTQGGTATSVGQFVVLPTQEFTLTVEPAIVTAIAGTSVSVQVRTVTTGGYTGLTSLSTGSLPAGVTASFSPLYLGPNASGLLTLTISETTPGSSTIEVQGTATIEGTATTRTASTRLNVQAPGQTVLLGQVWDEDEKPIGGVTIKLGGTTPKVLGTTDAGGNFLIPLAVAGSQVFLIDGSTANTSTVTYPTIPVTVNIQAGVVNTLGFTPHLMAHPRGMEAPHWK